MAAKLITLMGLYYFYVLGLGIYMFLSRVKAAKQRRVRASYYKSYQGEVPADLKVIENHFNNQFQVPIFWMIASLTALVMKAVSPTFFVLSLLFVGTRLAHSYVHLTSNTIYVRAGFFFAGVILVGVMWINLLLTL